ncbi:MAG TPA: hypothetical protein VE954_43270 [Oligoflexus sp.]|uniref:hypothetical protein n=1 Tax=Oligoflexus sp. TaxID=1971216 RepID=UPI002D2F87D0|nr:hypothetical protein [Oligoflexus sp.]HYX39966.1 hypothetical protein [Oligoflexus sp.]
MRTYRLRFIDAWGNEDEGYEFNDFTGSDTIRTRSKLASMSDEALLRWFIKNNWLKGKVKDFYVDDLAHGDGFCLNVCRADGKPLFELTSEEQ